MPKCGDAVRQPFIRGGCEDDGAALVVFGLEESRNSM